LFASTASPLAKETGKAKPAAESPAVKKPAVAWNSIATADYRKIGGGVLLPQDMRATLTRLLKICPRIPNPKPPPNVTCVLYHRPEKRIYYNFPNSSTELVYIEDGILYRRNIPADELENVKQFCSQLDQLWAKQHGGGKSKKKTR